MHLPQHFAADLDSLLAFAKEEYKKVSIDIPALQAGYLKTYLWLSSVLFAAEVAAFRALQGETAIPALLFATRPAFSFFACAGLLLALIAFGLGVDRMRYRHGFCFPVENFVHVGELAARADGKDAELTTRKTLLVNIQRAITNQTKEMHQKGLVLRKMSYCLLASAACALVAVLIFAAL